MKPILLVILTLAWYNCCAQTVTWNMAMSIGEEERDEATCIKSDPQGNIYTVGHYESGYLTWENITISQGSSSRGNFISKMAPDGNLLWLKNIPGGGFVNALDVDPAGNCFVTGYFSNAMGLEFGGDTIYTYPNGSYDMYLLKYDTDGNEAWGRAIGSDGQEYGYAVDVDIAGNIYIAGSVSGHGTTYFGSDTLTTTYGSGNIILAKFDSQGNEVWARVSDSATNGTLKAVTSDNNGNCYVLGSFSNPRMRLGDTVIKNTPTGGSNVLIAKYSSTGIFRWAKIGGGSGGEWPMSLAIDNSSNLLVLGYTSSASFVYDNTNLSSSNALADIFFLKTDSTGTLLWAKRIGGSNIERGNTVAVDNADNIFIAGEFITSPLSFDGATLISQGAYDAFVAQYSPQGTMQWVRAVGANFFEGVKSITTDNNGSVYVCGNFNSDTVSFDSHPIYNAGDVDVFIARFAIPVNVEESVNDNITLTIYPNPFTNTIEIKSLQQITSCVLYNATQQIIWAGKEIGEQDFSALSKGLYFLKVITDQSERMYKLIK